MKRSNLTPVDHGRMNRAVQEAETGFGPQGGPDFSEKVCQPQVTWDPGLLIDLTIRTLARSVYL